MKTVLITGASRGISNRSISFEAARQLAQQGYHVYLGRRNLAAGQRAAEGYFKLQALIQIRCFPYALLYS